MGTGLTLGSKQKRGEGTELSEFRSVSTLAHGTPVWKPELASGFKDSRSSNSQRCFEASHQPDSSAGFLGGEPEAHSSLSKATQHVWAGSRSHRAFLPG